MTTVRQLSQTSKSLLFFLLLLSLFWQSCGNSTEQISPKETLAVDTLPDEVGSITAATLIKNFQSADDKLAGDFYFGGVESSDNRAVYFRLTPQQTNAFFEELQQQKASATPEDSVQIRIHLAFFGKEGTERPDQPNLTLLMDVVKNNKTSNALDHPYYPLRPFLRLDKRAISNKLADSLTQNWTKIPTENLVQQLYLNGKISDVKNRIQYYTFNNQDTEAIYAYWGRNPDCGMFIYLGQYEEKDHVPLRVIIRLTKNPNTLPQGKNDGGENFEFAAPCPPVCQ